MGCSGIIEEFPILAKATQRLQRMYVRVDRPIVAHLADLEFGTQRVEAPETRTERAKRNGCSARFFRSSQRSKIETLHHDARSPLTLLECLLHRNTHLLTSTMRRYEPPIVYILSLILAVSHNAKAFSFSGAPLASRPAFFGVPSDESSQRQRSLLIHHGSRSSSDPSDESLFDTLGQDASKPSLDLEMDTLEKEVGGYDPSERIGTSEVNVGNPQLKVAEERDFSVTSILRELAAIQQQGPQKYCILGTRHCSFLHQQIIELL